ncbi:HAD hydrolase, family IIB [Mycoplasma putrefaciens]|nr:HAD hydrolase, family IIB [Mycoplasma putrefaciens]
MGLRYVVVDSADQIDEPITHLYIVTNNKATDEEKFNEYKYLIDKYSQHYKVDSYSNNRVFDISVKGIDKGSIVKKVKDYLNLDDKTHSYGFGDGPNDVSLLKACDTGVAMKNAILELKEIADDVSEFANDQDGVANYIYDKIIVGQ